MDSAADITIDAATPQNIDGHLERIRQIYSSEGAVILPGFLREDALFARFLADLSAITQELSRWAGVAIDPALPLDEQVSRLASVRRDLAGKIYDVGTRPNKLLSGMQLKLHPAFTRMTRRLFPEDAIIATPTLSDTLHVFPPGQDSYRFNLPVHQDYPYLLQSPNQVTFWVPLSRRHADAGGMTLWRGSHTLGVRRQQRDADGHLQCVADARELERWNEVRCEGDLGDVVVFHSNILHRSERNVSSNKTRLVQLFRFSDLRDEEARRIGWENADVLPRAKKFEDLYPGLIV